MSLNSSPVLELEPPSRRPHRRLLCVMLGMAVGIPWAVPNLGAAVALAMSVFNVAVLAAGWRAWMHSLELRVVWDVSGHWWLIDSQGQKRTAELRADSVAHPLYLWLKWNCDGRRMQRFVLRADCAPAAWRRWQARLHWQATRETARV